MKKKLLSYVKASALIIALISGKAFAQTAATATWALEANINSAVTGSVTATDQVFGDLVHSSYTVYTATAGFYTGVTVTGQRAKPAAGWSVSGTETARNINRYAQYNMTPATGNNMNVTSISFDFGDSGSTNTMKADVYYSTDGFTTETQLNTAALILPKHTVAGEMDQVKYTGLSIPVADTKTFSVRVYPWYQNTASTSKYLVERNVVITGTTTTAGTLPLDFLSLAGKADALGKTVNVNWSTTNEVNTKSFEVQRKTVGSDFATIGTLASKNSAGVHNYSFTDQNAANGTAYYRILQSDNDGASKLSNVIAVSNKAVSALSVYPNPAEQTLNVNHASAVVGANLKVLSLEGKTIFQKAVSVNSTSSNLDVSKLATGTYLLILDNISEKSSLKFIKK